jgi:hypothetical protein
VDGGGHHDGQGDKPEGTTPVGEGEAALAQRASKPESRRMLPQFHLVKAPEKECRMEGMSPELTEKWLAACQLARETFQRRRPPNTHTAHILIGSVKVNPVVDLLFASLFSTEPFKSQDDVQHPRDRSCPILFRYRDDDPQPPSCIGGLKLARNREAKDPGIYFETADGEWERCRWVENKKDAAFLLYAYQTGLARLDVACGGFSSRATDQMANDLEAIVSQIGKPAWNTESLRVGLHIIEFTVEETATQTPNGEKAPADYKRCEFKVHTVPTEALSRRLQRRRAAPAS